MVGPTSEGGFTVEPGRYHLACPWAYRSLIFRALKGLDKAISCQSCTGRRGVGGGSRDARVVYARTSLERLTDGPGVILDAIGRAQDLRGLSPVEPDLYRSCHRAGAVGQRT